MLSTELNAVVNRSNLESRYETVAKMIYSAMMQRKTLDLIKAEDVFASRCTAAALTAEMYLQALELLIFGRSTRNHSMRSIVLRFSAYGFFDSNAQSSSSSFAGYAANAKYHADEYDDGKAATAYTDMLCISEQAITLLKSYCFNMDHIRNRIFTRTSDINDAINSFYAPSSQLAPPSPTSDLKK